MGRGQQRERKPRLLLWALGGLLALGGAGVARAVDVEDIPSPRPRGWVTDQTGQIPAEIVAAINALGDEIHRRSGAEVAVVVIPTTGGQDLRRFATELFNHWGIGQADADNGILLLAALGDRKAEIILGDGIDEPGQVQVSERIMAETMVPLFRSGDPGQALLRGASRCAVEILNQQIDPPGAGSWGTESDPASAGAPAPLGLQGNAMAPAPNDPDPAGSFPWSILALGGGGAAGLGGAWYGVRRYLRYRPRTCPKCHLPMTLLDEAGDDAHLGAAEKVEERIGSVDYDVWSCPGCEQVVKLRYGAFLTSYARCPQCRARTKKSTSRTIRAATEYSSGLKKITERCAHCSYHNEYQRTIPRITRTSASSGSRSSGFSGGSSSGRGASGSW